MKPRNLEFYVIERVKKYTFSDNNCESRFRYLEEAHVIAQYHTFYHTLVHVIMLIDGIKRLSLREASGQIMRIVGALTKTPLGLLPDGNTGGANISPFKPLPVPIKLKRIIARIRPQKHR